MKRITCILLTIALLCAFGIPVLAADGSGIKITDTDRNEWTSIITSKMVEFIESNNKITVDDNTKGLISGAVLQNINDNREADAAAINYIASRQNYRSALGNLGERAFYAAAESLAAGGASFNVTLTDESRAYVLSSLADELYASFYLAHLKKSDSELSEAIMSYYNDNADDIVTTFNDQNLPFGMTIDAEQLGSVLASYTDEEHIGALSQMIDEIATAPGSKADRVALIESDLNIVLTDIVQEMINNSGLSGIINVSFLSAYIANFAEEYANTIGEQYNTWLASSFGSGSLPFITGVLGIIIGSGATLLIVRSRRKKAAKA